jgi:hypothetical protein
VTEQTILASDLRVITRYLTSLGMDPAPALTAAGIDASALSEPRGRVSAQQVEALLTQLVEQFPDRNLGLAMASHHHMTDTHVLGLTAIASATGLEALRRLVRYQALVSTQEPFTITEDTETVTLSKKAVHGDTTEHLIQVFIFAVILTAIRNISGFTGDLTGIASLIFAGRLFSRTARTSDASRGSLAVRISTLPVDTGCSSTARGIVMLASPLAKLTRGPKCCR